MSSASGTFASIIEVITPRLLKERAVLVDYPLDLPYFRAPQSSASLHPHRIEPELRYLIAMRNVHVLRFITISGVEEETNGPSLRTDGMTVPSDFGGLRRTVHETRPSGGCAGRAMETSRR